MAEPRYLDSQPILVMRQGDHGVPLIVDCLSHQGRLAVDLSNADSFGRSCHQRTRRKDIQSSCM